MPELLIELLSEEIPARMQARAAEDLQKRMTDGLVAAGLSYNAAAAFATPRRLALVVDGLASHSPAQKEERKGPRVDAPQKALDGFLRSTGLTQADLETREDKKGPVWFAVIEKPGRPAAEIAAEVLAEVIRTFPWPKSMRWGDGTLRWVRPLQSILAILSDESGTAALDLAVDGVRAGAESRGHRFLSSGTFSVANFEDYDAKLKQSMVVLRAEDRAAIIRADADQLAFAQGLEVVDDPGLLAEVAGLVEWPRVLMGDIDAAFLSLPTEVLQTSMRAHQKFLAVRHPERDRIERYIIVANTDTDDDGAAILAGNAKVLAARLSDAAFFWTNDLREARAGMGAWKSALASVTFQRRLGSQQNRVARIESLAREIAPLVGADPELAGAAASVAKADLASEMVYEFPELQGVMGRYYALEAGMDAAIADAVRDHYAPLGPSDSAPTAPVSVAVALADKLDLLCGFWAIDEKPTGSKDPFALRRAALGVIRLLLENDIRVSLRAQALDLALRQYSLADETDHAEVLDDLMAFIQDRLKQYLRSDGMPHDVIEASLAAAGTDDPGKLVARAEALRAFLADGDGENLVQGFKRANNILAAEEKKDGIEYSLDPDVSFAESDAERSLFAALDTADAASVAALETESFGDAMNALAALRSPIDAFFDAAQVNAGNQIVRRNRLCLLNRIRVVMGRVAAFDRLEG